MPKVLIIDDEVKLRTLLARILTVENFQVLQAGDCKSGLQALQQDNEIDVVLCDVKLPDGNGLALSKEIKVTYPAKEIILLTAYGNIPDGVQAIKNGAFDYITKGDDNNKIIPLLNQAMEKAAATRKNRVERNKHTRFTFEDIIGKSKALTQCVELAQKVSKTDTTVLLTGETGTGKEVFAQTIHSASHRNGKSFTAINCAAFSKEMLEAELFGHKAGAFTGAGKDQKGLLEEADNGTLFLDEIGEMPIDLQGKILRVLENGEFIKIGETKPTKINVRIIAATNRNLTDEIKQGNFREDLFYRISVFSIHLPALRDRKEDIPLYIHYFIKIFGDKIHNRPILIQPNAINALTNYPWKGNIRELRNVMERSVIILDNSELQTADLPAEIQRYSISENGAPLSEFSMAAVEKLHIQKTLAHTAGNKAEAARLLGIGIATLYRKIEEYKPMSFS